MNISEKGLNLIKEYEGFSAIPYMCPADKLTIGFGHVILKNENFKTITKDQATELLKKDCHIAEDCINKNVLVCLNQDQFDALVSLVYNIGTGAFSKSTLLRLLNEGKYSLASEQFGRWIYGQGRVLNGLVNRREKERLLFLGEY